MTLERFEESLAATERALGHEQAEGKALAKQKADVERAMHAATDKIKARLPHLLHSSA